MSGVHQILVSTPARRLSAVAAALAASLLLGACGQKGPLYLPTGEAAAGRRTLPQTLTPTVVAPDQPSPTAPSAISSSPAATTPGAPERPEVPPAGTAAPTRQP